MRSNEFKIERNKGKYMSTSICLKKSNSLNRFIINPKLIITKTTYKSDFRNKSEKNFI